MRPLLLTLAAFTFVACGAPSEDDFQDKVSKQFCSLAQECEPAEFEAMFSSADECRDWYEDLLDDVDDDACTYQPDEAAECLKAIKAVDCDSMNEQVDACDRVYVCNQVDF